MITGFVIPKVTFRTRVFDESTMEYKWHDMTTDDYFKGKRYGIRKSYYTKIGRTSYETVSEVLHPELFGQLAKHFDFLGDFIGMSVKNDHFF